MTPRRLTPAVIAAALVTLLAIVETAAALTARGRIAGDEDWNAAAAEVRAGMTAGDLVVFAPGWVDQIGRAHLGDVIPVEMAARADADPYARIWEVSIRGAHAPEAATAHLVHESRHGLVRVALYEKPAASVVWDFTAHSDEARVTENTDGARDESPCYRDVGSGFRCPGTRVERRTLEVDYQPRRGILVPLDGPRVTHLAFSEVPLGGALVFYAGLHDYYARKSGDGLVSFVVVVDGRELLRGRIGNSDGWKRFDLDTRALAGSRHDVRIDISSTRPAWRNFGFHAEARR